MQTCTLSGSLSPFLSPFCLLHIIALCYVNIYNGEQTMYIQDTELKQGPEPLEDNLP
jgi:hypothetical protein